MRQMFADVSRSRDTIIVISDWDLLCERRAPEAGLHGRHVLGQQIMLCHGDALDHGRRFGHSRHFFSRKRRFLVNRLQEQAAAL